MSKFGRKKFGNMEKLGKIWKFGKKWKYGKNLEKLKVKIKLMIG